MLFPDGKDELIQDSWRVEHHDLVDCPVSTGVTAVFNIAVVERDGRPGSSLDDAGTGHVPWTGSTPPLSTES